MASVTVFTAARMLAIEAASIISAVIVGNDLILTKFDFTTINAGNIQGPVGPQGPVGEQGSIIVVNEQNFRSSAQIDSTYFGATPAPTGTFIQGLFNTAPKIFVKRAGKWHYSATYIEIT